MCSAKGLKEKQGFQMRQGLFILDTKLPRGLAAVAPRADRGCLEFILFAFTTSADGSV